MEEEELFEQKMSDSEKLLNTAKMQGEIAKNFSDEKSEPEKNVELEKGTNTKIPGFRYLLGKNDGLYTQVSPTTLYKKEALTKLGEEKKTKREMEKITKKRIENRALIEGGGAYRYACTKYMEEQHHAPVTYLVLGKRDDGSYGNATAYMRGKDPNAVFGLQTIWKEGKGITGNNIHKFEIDQKTAKEEWGNNYAVTVYHANIAGINDHHFDSNDIETLFHIYKETLGSNKPLSIHDDLGLDETGITLAFMLMHDYEKVFNNEYAANNAENVKNEIALTPVQAGGVNFCRDADGRYEIACSLAHAMKSVQVSEQLIHDLGKMDLDLSQKINDIPTFIGKLFFLEGKKSDYTYENDLRRALEARATSEARYFQKTGNPSILPYIVELNNNIKNHPKLSEDLLKEWNNIKKMLIEGKDLNDDKLKEVVPALSVKINNVLVEPKEIEILDDVAIVYEKKPVAKLSRKNFFSRLFEKKPYTAQVLRNKMHNYFKRGINSHYRNEMNATVIAFDQAKENNSPMSEQDILANILIRYAKRAGHQPNDRSRITKLLKEFYDHNPDDFKAAVKDEKNSVLVNGDDEKKPLIEALRDKSGNTHILTKMFDDIKAEMGKDIKPNLH